MARRVTSSAAAAVTTRFTFVRRFVLRVIMGSLLSVARTSGLLRNRFLFFLYVLYG